MKNQDIEKMELVFSDYLISDEDMICIKGGEGDPVFVPTPPISRV